MTVGTVLYAWTLTLLVGAVAVASESLVRQAGRQARWIWIAAGLTSVMLGILPLLPSGDPPGSDDIAPPTVTVGPAFRFDMAEAGADALRWQRASAEAAFGHAPAAPDGPLLSARIPHAFVAWGGLSALLLLLSILGFHRLGKRRKEWRGSSVAGIPVLLSRDFGPAAVGLLRGRIVLPAWMVGTVDAEQLRMAVVHELEHIRGRDLPLLALFGLLVVAMPWNLPLWWQARRLSRSVELDCDRRVVGRGHDPRAYGELLIAMSGPTARSSPLLVPALGRGSLLRARIAQLAHHGPGRAATTLVSVTGLVAIAAACSLPAPTAPVDAPDVSAGSDNSSVPVVDASIVDHRGLRALTSELGESPAIEDARGVVALAVRVDEASSAVRHVRIDQAVGPSVSSRAVEATVTEVAARLRVRAKPGHLPDGWVPVWVLFTGSTVEAHLVKHELYQERGWPEDDASLGRHMDVFYRLRSGGPGELDLARGIDMAEGRGEGVDVSYAMAASDRPGVQQREALVQLLAPTGERP